MPASPPGRRLFADMGDYRPAAAVNPNGANPQEELKRLFVKHGLPVDGHDPGSLDRFLNPRDEQQNPIPACPKINSPELFYKLGVSSDKCYEFLAASEEPIQISSLCY